MDIDQDSAGVTFPPPLLFLGVLLAGLAIDHFSWLPIRLPLGETLERGLGWLLIVAGAAVILTAVGLFRKAGTNPEPWKPTSGIVTDGVYGWTRYPMYLGMASLYAGIAVLFDSVIALALLVPVVLVIQRQVIEREEAYLEGKFGEPYRAYKAKVGRWFGAKKA